MRPNLINKRKTKRRLNLKFLFFGGLFFCLILGLAYLLFFSPYFKINPVLCSQDNINAPAQARCGITIKGTERVSQDEILNLTKEVLNGSYFKIIPQNSLILFPEQKLEELLKERIPSIKEVKITKKISTQPFSLIIEIKERERVMVYCGEIKCFYLDEDGFAFEEAPEIYGGLGLTLKDNSKREVKIKEIAINKDLVSFLSQVKELLEESLSLSLLNFQIDFYPTRDLTAITSEGWQIFFNPTGDPKTQVQALKMVLEEKIKEQRNQLEYIDLRVENRVYYRYRE